MPTVRTSTDVAGRWLALATPQLPARHMETLLAPLEVLGPCAQFVPLAALALEGSASECFVFHVV